ncbi:MAG: hypothetical protein ACYCXU_01340 [Thermoleophilia bacterium]
MAKVGQVFKCPPCGAVVKVRGQGSATFSRLSNRFAPSSAVTFDPAGNQT